MDSLRDKVCVITGGASGIGAATGRLFVAEGAKVVIADVADGPGASLVGELGASALYSHTDVSRASDIERLINATIERFGRLDCLFNNAGVMGENLPIEETTPEGLRSTMAVLLDAVILGMRYAAPVMLKQRSGSIINTGSVAALQAGLGPHLYSAAKAAVLHLSKSVALELATSGIRVNCICPGGIATPIIGQLVGLTPLDGDKVVPTAAAAFSRAVPLRRAGQPEDVAQAALWLASDDSSFVTGHALVVDGGLSAGRPWREASEMFRRALRFAGQEKS